MEAFPTSDQLKKKFETQKKIILSKEDNIESLYEKNYQLQLDLLPISLNLVLKNEKFKILEMGEYNNKMSFKTQLIVIEKINQYIKNNTTNENQKN